MSSTFSVCGNCGQERVMERAEPSPDAPGVMVRWAQCLACGRTGPKCHPKQWRGIVNESRNLMYEWRA